MPMRGELAFPATRPDGETVPDRDAWTVIGICLIGLLMSFLFAASSTSLDQLPLLITQFNLG